MSCYIDIGESGVELGPGANQITVNPGVREDFVDAFLTRNNLMFKTATAGGFFSIGGTTAVDVHGGTIDAPIFAETVSALTIVGADSTETVIDASTAPSANGGRFSSRGSHWAGWGSSRGLPSMSCRGPT